MRKETVSWEGTFVGDLPRGSLGAGVGSHLTLAAPGVV